MKTVAVLAVVALAAIGATYMMTSTTDSNAEAQFQDFVATYRKSYMNSDEYTLRLGVFQQNLAEIASLNAANPDATYAVNEFADWTVDERLAILGWKPSTGKKNYLTTVGEPTKDDVNWVDAQETTPVKDQKSCGSCWAFAGVETLESVYAVAKGLSGADIPVFAEQQLVDCAKYPAYGSYGCQGGWMDDVYDYAMDHAMCLESEYPYTARDGTCSDSKCSFDAEVTGRVNIPEGDLDALLEATELFPVAIAVDASSWSFYQSGIHKSSGTALNHGVQIDGYHYHSADGDYLLVRNSWGQRWGEKGYITLAKGDTCGVEQYIYKVTV